MATYFGYVEREADSYVNWADVGRNMSATIDNIQRVRDEKKALIEKAYNEDLDYIQSRPSGEHETLNAWSLNFGDTSAQNLKLKYSQLKQGKISVNDFVRFRQNLTDSVEKIYTVNSQLQEAFKKVNDRTKAGDNQELERATKVLLEKYGALENTLPYVNGLTGTVAIGLTEITKDAEGKEVRKLRQGDDAYLTPQQLQAASMQEFNAYNEQADLDKWVESLGDVQQDMREIGGETLAGLILSVTDVTSEAILEKAKNLPEGSKLSEAEMKQLEKYVKTFNLGETEYINGILANPYNASALLTDRIKINPDTKKPYNIVFNKADQKTTNDLYVEKTPEGKFTPKFDTEIGEKQADQLRGFLKNQLRAKYDRKVEMKPYNEPTPPRPGTGGRFDEGANRYAGEQLSKAQVADKILNLKVGEVGEKESSINYIRGLKGVNQKKTKYDPLTGTLEVYSSDPDKPEPFVYQFEDLYDNKGRLIRKKTDMSNEDFVFQLLSIAYPDLEDEYGDYLKTVNKEKQENLDIPISKEIADKEKEIEKLKEKDGGSGFYAPYILFAEDELENLRKKQAAQGKRQGQGGRTNKLNADDRTK